MGAPTDEQQQQPAEGPGPGESQADYDRRTGAAAPFDQQAAGAGAGQPTVAELEQQLADAKARERDTAGAGNAAQLARPAGPPAGQAADALAPRGAQMPAPLAQAPAGSMGGDRPEPEERVQVTHTEPVLAQGAAGETVVRLVKLLADAGYASNTIVHGENAADVLDRSVMADVERFWDDHPDAREPDELFAGRDGSVHELRGTWIGPYTWQALYDLAGAAGGAK